MGNDFLDKTKGTIEKGWDQGLQDLAKADLFTIPPEGRRTIVVKPVNGSSFSVTEIYELRQDQAHIAVYQDGQQIGVCERPGPYVLNRISQIGGMALGIVNRFRVRSGGVDITVILNLG